MKEQLTSKEAQATKAVTDAAETTRSSDKASLKAMYKSAKCKKIDKSAHGADVEVAAGQLANVVAGIATGAFNINIAGLEDQLKAGFSNDTADEEIRETAVDRGSCRLIDFRLKKTNTKKTGHFTFFRGSKCTIRVKGEMCCVEAANETALDNLYEVVNKEADRVITHLLEEDSFGEI